MADLPTLWTAATTTRGLDAPLWGMRESDNWRDTIYLGGFWEPASCSAIRSRKSSLIISGGLPGTERVWGTP